MHQQALAVLILRIIGFVYFFLSLGGIMGAGFFSSQSQQWAEWSSSNEISLFTVVATSPVGIQFCFGLVLLIFTQPLARLLFPEDSVLVAGKELSVETLTRVAVPLVGLFFCVKTFPKFIYFALLWFVEEATPKNDSFYSPVNSGFFQNTILLLISFFIIIKRKAIIKVLIKGTA
jgi:hypothetical protein